MSELTLHIDVTERRRRAIDLLAEHCPLPRQRLKDALQKGAVWLEQGKRAQRLRRATKELPVGARLSLYYDAELLQRSVAAPTLLADESAYSVWFKPAGMLTQGTPFGDHCALLRLCEIHWQPPRPSFLVHRLDREAQGLVLIAHNPRAAALFSELWQQRQVQKRYEVIVEGCPAPIGEMQRIDAPLDGKPAQTEFTVTAVEGPRSTLAVDIITGRKHQIRRHLAGIGHPVVGDWRYGSGGEKLALTAVALAFRCPLTGAARSYRCAPAPSDISGQ